jgi:hypothetical protein
MISKLFPIEDLNALLVEMGYNSCRSNYVDESVEPRLKLVNFHDSCIDDVEGRSIFTLTFMDPHDDLFYQASCYYDKASCYGDWNNDVVDATGSIVNPCSHGRTGPTRGYISGDMMKCVRVEKRKITIESWEVVEA